MRIGKLVNWYSGFWDNKKYKNPGLVLSASKSTKTYHIMWSDGKITVENEGYLKEV